MDADSVNDEFVFGLDNADCLGTDGHLFNYDASAVEQAEVAFNAHRKKVTTNAQIERDVDKAEIARLRDELLKAMTEIQTLRACNSKLHDRIPSKTPTKGQNSAETKSKVISRLQKELDERTRFCENMSNKLKSYRLKYKSAKKTLSGLMTQPELLQAQRVIQLEEENSKLIKKITLQSSTKAQEPSLGQGKYLRVPVPLGSELIFEKLKAKASRMEGDARRIVSTVGELRELFKDLAISTPSTRLHDDDKLFIELSQIEEEGNLGKRVGLDYDQEDSQSTIKSDLESKDVYQQSSGQSMEEDSPSHELVTKNLAMQLENISLEAPATPHVTSMVPIGPLQLVQTTEETNFAAEPKKIYFMKKDTRTSSASEEESSLGSEDSGKAFIPSIDKKIIQLNKCREPKTVGDKQLKESLQSVSNFIISEELHSAIAVASTKIPTQQLEAPALVKVSMPSFLSKPVEPKLVAGKPNIRIMNPIEPIWTIQPPSQETDSKPREPEQTESLDSDQGFFDGVWALCASFDLANPQASRKNIFATLEEFRKRTVTIHKLRPIAIMELLLQTDIESQSYLVKNLINCRDYKGQLNNDVYLMYVFQSVFFLIIVSCYETSLDAVEAPLFEYFQAFQNKCGFLADKFDRLKDIVRLSTKVTETNKPGTRNPKTSEKGHHFALLKIVFDHLILAVERKIYKSDNDDFFSSHLLAQKQNLAELTNTAHYIMEKVARSSAEITFMQGLPDLLSSFHKLFQVCKTLDMKFNKAFYDAFRGFFSSRKYRNTTQQVLACLILRQFSSLQ